MVPARSRKRDFVTHSTHLGFSPRRRTNCSTLIINGPSIGPY
jgi:hypothetical protein